MSQPSVYPHVASAWDSTPVATHDTDATPTQARWDATPKTSKRSRWDETPDATRTSDMMTPGATPKGNLGMITPVATNVMYMTPEQISAMRHKQEMDARNRPWTDEELNELLPPEGYEILVPPPGYKRPEKKLTATPTPLEQNFYHIPEEKKTDYDVPVDTGDLPFSKPEDYTVCSCLIHELVKWPMSVDCLSFVVVVVVGCCRLLLLLLLLLLLFIRPSPHSLLFAG